MNNLSDAMILELKTAFLSTDGAVMCQVLNGNTRRALIARGATARSGTYLMLDMGLTMACVAAYRDVEYVTEYIEHELDTYGQCDSGRGPDTTAGMWHRVRAGELTAERGTVAGWGSYHRGWIFRPVAPTDTQRLAADRVARERAELPQWQRDRMSA